jgi:hypothetical protein
LNEFYELKQSELLNKRFSGVIINPICDLTPQIIREVQNCAIDSDDVTPKQSKIIEACLKTTKRYRVLVVASTDPN